MQRCHFLRKSNLQNKGKALVKHDEELFCGNGDGRKYLKLYI